MMTTTSLLDRAISVLRLNDTGVFTKPGPHQYPHQWNWDAALVALGLSHFDLPRAQGEIRALLSGQWQDGMLPHVVYHNVPSFKSCFLIGAGVIGGGGFQHTDQCCCFFNAEPVWFLGEKSTGGIADAIYVVAERNGIQVQGQYFLLGKVPFQLYGNDIFL